MNNVVVTFVTISERSASAQYGDNAIGYVSIKRNGVMCTVEARITPQTSVNRTPYLVSVSINESDNSIAAPSCNCQASMGTLHLPYFIQ